MFQQTWKIKSFNIHTFIHISFSYAWLSLNRNLLQKLAMEEGLCKLGRGVDKGGRSVKAVKTSAIAEKWTAIVENFSRCRIFSLTKKGIWQVWLAEEGWGRGEGSRLINVRCAIVGKSRNTHAKSKANKIFDIKTAARKFQYWHWVCVFVCVCLSLSQLFVSFCSPCVCVYECVKFAHVVKWNLKAKDDEDSWYVSAAANVLQNGGIGAILCLPYCVRGNVYV